MSCANTSVVELPIKSWSEIDGWYVKWDNLHYTLDGATWHEVALCSDPDTINMVDWKRPLSVEIIDPATDEMIDQDG